MVKSAATHTFPTAASPSSTSLTLLDGLGVFGAESAIKDTGEFEQLKLNADSDTRVRGLCGAEALRSRGG